MTNAVCLVLTNAATNKVLELYDPTLERNKLSHNELRTKALEIVRKTLGIGTAHQCIVRQARREGYLEICVPSVNLVFQGAVEDEPQEFVVTSIRSMGKYDSEAPWSKTATLQFYDQGTIPSFVEGVDQEFWEEIRALPSEQEFIELMTQRVRDWEQYLWIMERIAEQKQFSLRYETFRSNLDWTVVEFVAAQHEPISWNQIKRFENDKLHLQVRSESPILLGTLTDYNAKERILCIELEDSVRHQILEGKLKIPESATLVYKNQGTLTEINRQRNALRDLVEGKTGNKHLANLLFDLDEYLQDFVPNQLDIDEHTFINPNLDHTQKQAVVGALEAKDFYLIKGPPGTGKTTVIAEICAQAARQGKKILVASQTNVAVDNVLEKFVNVPNIRAIRFKNDLDYDEETDLFSPQNAVGQWLNRILLHSQKRWEEYRNAPELLKEINDIFDTAKLYAAVKERLATIKSELSAHAQQMENNRLLIQDNQVKLNSFNEQLRTLELLSAALQDQDLARFAFLFENWDEKDLFQTNSASAFADKIKPIIYQMRKSFALDNQPLDSPDEVIQVGLNNYIWYKGQRREINSLISHLDGAVDELAYFQEVHENYQANLDNLEELKKHYARESAVYTANSVKIEEFQDILSQLQNLEINSDKFQKWAAWFTGKLSRTEDPKASQKLAIEKAPVLSYASGEAQAKLVSLTEKRIKHELRQCLEAMEARKNLLETLEETKQIINRFDSATEELLERIPNPDNVSQADSERLFRSKISVGAIDQADPDAEILASIRAEVQALVDNYLNRGFAGVVGNVWRTVSFGLGSLFGGGSVAEKKEAFLQEGLMVCQAGKDYFSKLRTQWQELEAQSKKTLEKLTQQLAWQSIGIVEDALHYLISEYKEKIRELHIQQQDQDKVVQRLKVQCGQLEQEIGIIQNKLDSIYNACVTSLQIINVWSTYPGLQKPIDALLHASDYTQIEESYYELNRELELFSDLVLELDSLDLSSELRPVITGIVEEVSSHIENCQINVGKLKIESDELGRARDKLDKEYQSILGECEDYAEKWEVQHKKLQEITRVDLPQEEDVHSFSYLQQLQELYQVITTELKQISERAARAEDFAADWHKALTDASRYEKEQLKSLYLRHCNLIGSTCSQTARSEFKEFGQIDYVIVDEVSKATPPELLMPLLHGKSLVLVGDDKQLPPMIGHEAITELAEELDCTKEELAYLKRSLFAELWSKAPDTMGTMLLKQYRMHSSIMQVINQFYDDQLELGYESLDANRNHNCGGGLFSNDCHAVWIDVPQYADYAEKDVGTSYVNVTEIKIMEQVLKELNNRWKTLPEHGNDQKKIGIITFYGAQERRIRQQIDIASFPNLQIEIGTVDRFQGREYPIVIVSMVRNNNRGDVGHAKVPERVNVALSRAQELLILIGCGSLFCQRANLETTQIYSRVAQEISAQGGMKHVHHFLMDR